MLRARLRDCRVTLVFALFAVAGNGYAAVPSTQPVAATVALTQSASSVRQEHAAPALDLRAPAITDVMTQEQINAVLRRAIEPRNIEEVEVDRARVYDPETESYIPAGFASLFWAAGQPSGLWRLFTPRLATRLRENINPTNASQPAPGIPAMAGESRRFDK